MSGKGAASKGRLIVVSGPSGSGKTTIVNRLKRLPGVYYSVSATSRAPRRGEIAGSDYFFVSREGFERMIAAGELAEHAEVAGNLYGTPRGPLDEALEKGLTVLVDIDVNGAMQIKRRFPEAILVFIEPPSMEVLEERLKGRGTESTEALERRLSLARREMKSADEYDYRVINDSLEKASAQIERIVLGRKG